MDKIEIDIEPILNSIGIVEVIESLAKELKDE